MTVQVGDISRKVIHIGIGPMTETLYNALCVKVCNENKIEVLYFDLSLLFFDKKTKSHFGFEKFVVEIKSYQQLKELFMANCVYSIFNVMVNYEVRFLPLFYYLQKYRCYHIKIANGYFPEWENKKNLKRLIKAVTKKKLLKFLNSIRLISFPKYVFACGSYWKENFEKVSKVIEVNHIDCDFLELKKYDFLDSQDNIIVFLDQYLPFHPDIGIVGASALNSDEYFTYMKKCFDFFEDKYNAPVVVAAHPKSMYIGDEYGERKILKNIARELVNKSKCVLAHYSGSINYAILYEKPLYLVTYKEFELKNKMGACWMNDMAQHINVPIVDIDFLPNIEVDITMENNIEDIKKIKYKYLTSLKCEEISNSHIICEKFLEIFEEIKNKKN